jgi:hypothetical protein
LFSVKKRNAADLLLIILNWVGGRASSDNSLGGKVILFRGSKGKASAVILRLRGLLFPLGINNIFDAFEVIANKLFL